MLFKYFQNVQNKKKCTIAISLSQVLNKTKMQDCLPMNFKIFSLSALEILCQLQHSPDLLHQLIALKYSVSMGIFNDCLEVNWPKTWPIRFRSATIVGRVRASQSLGVEDGFHFWPISTWLGNKDTARASHSLGVCFRRWFLIRVIIWSYHNSKRQQCGQQRVALKWWPLVTWTIELPVNKDLQEYYRNWG